MKIPIKSDIFEHLTIVFVVLKLCNMITWSWFWVLFPTIVYGTLYVVGIFNTLKQGNYGYKESNTKTDT